MLAVDHDNKARLFTVEELFDNDAVTRIAKGIACQHIVYRSFCLFQGHRHNDAFTRGQTVGFNDDRRAFLAQVGQSRLNLGKVLILGGGNVMPSEEILSKRFRAFKLGGTLSRAKDFQSRSLECIYHANHQRRFRANDSQIDLLVLGEAQQGRDIRRAHGDVLQSWLQRRTGVAGRNKNGAYQRGLGRFPRQGMLASAVTNN